MTHLPDQAELFLSRLMIELKPLGPRLVSDIIRESRMHLLVRSSQGQLRMALAAFGPPEVYARAFLADHENPEPKLSTIPTTCYRAGSKLFGKVLQKRQKVGPKFPMAITVGCLLGITAASLGIAEILAPENTGLFIGKNSFAFGLIDSSSLGSSNDVLGRSFAVYAFSTACLAFVFCRQRTRSKA